MDYRFMGDKGQIMLYLIQVCIDDDARKPQDRVWMRIYSQVLLNRKRRWASVSFALGCRLIRHLERKGHTVIRI